jgi:TolA-binding protein
MSKPDLLKRAAQTLRSEIDGKRTGSGFTRARIMKTLHQRRRQRVTWWATLAPATALLLGGSAWAQSTDSWPVVWRSISSALAIGSTAEGAGKASEAPVRRSNDIKTRPPLPETPDEAPAPPEVPSQVEPEAPSAVATRRHAGRGRLAGASTTASEPPLAAPNAEIARDPELAQFRHAHDLHFRGRSPQAAIDAYRSYLSAFPSGRFVREALYNIAVDTIRLGRYAEAKALLEPFAEGKQGPNRQQAARDLLESLDGAR